MDKKYMYRERNKNAHNKTKTMSELKDKAYCGNCMLKVSKAKRTCKCESKSHWKVFYSDAQAEIEKLQGYLDGDLVEENESLKNQVTELKVKNEKLQGHLNLFASEEEQEFIKKLKQ